MRAFKSKTPPLLADTTVLFPPKKGQRKKEEEDFASYFFFLVFRYFDLRLLCSSLLLSVYSLSALVLVCSTNVERTREAPNLLDTSNWLLPSTPKASNMPFFLSFFLNVIEIVIPFLIAALHDLIVSAKISFKFILSFFVKLK